MDYTFSYLIGGIYLLLIWMIIYFFKKSVRKVMLEVSLIGAIIGPLMAYFWVTIGWWHPANITNTIVGFEDLLYGFVISGISVSIYQFIFNKKYIKKLSLPKTPLIKTVTIFIISTILCITFIHPVWGTFIPLIGFFIYFINKRKDLIKTSLLSGLLLIIINIPFYLIIEYITPGWILNTWVLKKITGIFILGIPIEDYIWLFLVGTNGGIFYQYQKGLIEAIKKRK